MSKLSAKRFLDELDGESLRNKNRCRIIQSIENSFLKSILEIWNSREIWIHLGNRDRLARFRGSKLGIFWYVVNQSFLFLIVAGIWSKLFNLEYLDFAGYLGLGLAIWNFISIAISESCISIQQYSSIFLNTKLPLVVAPMRVFYIHFGNLIIAAILPALLTLINYGWQTRILLVIPSLILVSLLLVQISISVSFIGLKYKDFVHLIQSGLVLLWFLTPVIYKAEQISNEFIVKLLELNPLSWMLSLLRNPFLLNSESYSNFSFGKYYLMTSSLLLVLLTINWKLFASNSRRVLKYV